MIESDATKSKFSMIVQQNNNNWNDSETLIQCVAITVTFLLSLKDKYFLEFVKLYFLSVCAKYYGIFMKGFFDIIPEFFLILYNKLTGDINVNNMYDKPLFISFIVLSQNRHIQFVWSNHVQKYFSNFLSNLNYFPLMVIWNRQSMSCGQNTMK